MLINRLKLTYDQNRGKNSLFLRSLLKEQLQFYVLNFVYNSNYAGDFLFKGGTCLRFCFDLPRLSEDLDFDVKNYQDFSFEKFVSNLNSYFKSKLQFERLNIKIAGKNKIVYLEFPILQEIGFPVSRGKPSENTLFLRVDLAPVLGKSYHEEVMLKSTADFSFLIRRYSLSDLFAGKIAAVLKREAFEADKLKPRFKGRDFFDLFWFVEKKVSINYPYLSSLTGIGSKEELQAALFEKIQEAKKRKDELMKDLLPFIENEEFVTYFAKSLDKLKLDLPPDANQFLLKSFH